MPSKLLNDPSDCFYGIIKGSVDIIIESCIEIKTDSVDNQGNIEVKKEVIKRLINLKEESVFGELGLINNTKRSADCIAHQDTDLFVVTRDCYNNYFKKCLEISEKNKRVFMINIFSNLSNLDGKVMYNVCKKSVVTVSFINYA